MKRYSSIGGLALLLAVGLLFSCSSKEPGSSDASSEREGPVVDSEGQWAEPFRPPPGASQEGPQGDCDTDDGSPPLLLGISVYVAGAVEHVEEVRSPLRYTPPVTEVHQPEDDQCLQGNLRPGLLLHLRMDDGSILLVHADSQGIASRFESAPLYSHGELVRGSAEELAQPGQRAAIPVRSYNGSDAIQSKNNGVWFFERNDGSVGYNANQNPCDFTDLADDSPTLTSWTAAEQYFGFLNSAQDVDDYFSDLDWPIDFTPATAHCSGWREDYISESEWEPSSTTE